MDSYAKMTQKRVLLYLLLTVFPAKKNVPKSFLK